MNDAPPSSRQRILVIDDNPAIHDDIRKILDSGGTRNAALTDSMTLLFGDKSVEPVQDTFEIESAYQGEEGLAKAEAASAAGRPFALAFVDVRMPPGWDGVETITRLWEKQPDLQVVLCTAYSDYAWEDMIARIGRSSSMVVLKKPFDNIEVLQLAHALTEKWVITRQLRDQLQALDQLVDRRTVELRTANAQLKREMAERLQVEQALVLSEERFSKAFKANPIPLVIQSLQHETITDANPGFEALTGYRRDELCGRTPQQLGLWAEPDQARLNREELRRHHSLRLSPCRLRTHTGAVRDILLSIAPIELGGEPGMLTIAQDITEQLQLEKQLRHSQKMEAVGQLAAGIAHDFNNMLTVIQGNTSLVLADLADSPERPMLEGILAAAQRSAKLVRQLLTFSHKQIMEVAPMDPGELLRSLAEMLSRMLGEQIAVQVDAPPGLPLIVADAGMIEQMLLNLAVNARDAMPHGGRLTITAETVDITDTARRVNQEARPGRFLRLSMSDTGCGIPPEVLPRIFEPFFTTKPIGKGTGLGLATVYGIAKQHEGWVEVRSQPERGTTFEIFFPLNHELSAVAATTLAQAAPPAHGAETILVVEDEETVRHCVAIILKSHGYNIITAGNGLEALAVWREHGRNVDLLLTDMVMPEGLTGLDLAKRLLVDKPDLKIIFTSGYSRDLTNSNAPFLAGRHFLAKPYQSSALLETVRESLAAGGVDAGAHPSRP
jgi:PAS domain S-box-containing protein